MIHRVEGWLLEGRKASYGIAVTRMLLALTALGILCSNYTTRLYTWGAGGAWSDDLSSPRSDFPRLWLFSSFRTAAADPTAFTALYLVVGVLALLVLVGYRTRLVLPVFLVLWISLVELQDMVGDKGDNMFRIALIAMLFADTSGRWSIDARRRARHPRAQAGTWIGTLLHNLAIVVLTCQVCFVYVGGALYKVGGASWQNGTAVYAPLQTERFGTWPELSDLLTASAPLVGLITTGTLMAQLAFPGALLHRVSRRLVLAVMIGFHAGIGVLMGLPWFSLAMIAIDAIFVRDATWQRLLQGTKHGLLRFRLLQVFQGLRKRRISAGRPT